MRIDIKQLEFIDKNLRDLVVWLGKRSGLEFTATSLYRVNDTGVHGTLPLRGIDLRVRDVNTGTSIEALVNDSWTYDTERPNLKCAILHGIGSNMHLHLQVHPSTRIG